MKLEFDHVGFVTDVKKGEENWVEETRVWVTNPKVHPFHVEWLRFEKDSPVSGPVRESPHIAYRVDSIEDILNRYRMRVVLEPFEVGGFLRVGFYQTEDGVVVELMEYRGSDTEWFPKKDGD